MSSPDFQNHAGGVIQVAHAGRWGAVPEALLEDPCLSLDARAVGAWLAIKANGWVINIAALRRALGDKKPLGKEKWLRIARELEGAGYFRRSCAKGIGGRWVWTITFSAVVGFADHGGAAAGRTATGKPARKPKRTEPKPSQPSPLPPTDRGGSGDGLIYPRLSAPERTALEGLLVTVPPESQQPLLDEVAAAIALCRIKVTPIAFARGLVQAASEGRFTPSLGVSVTAARQATATAANLPTAPFVVDRAAQATGERLLQKIREKANA